MVFVEDELFQEFLGELDLLKVKFSFLVNKNTKQKKKIQNYFTLQNKKPIFFI